MDKYEMPARLLKMKEHLYVKNEYDVEHQSVGATLPEKEVDFLRETYGIDADKKLHRMCVNCQARQLIKYYGEQPSKGEINKFSIRCDGVPKSLGITRDALESVMAQKDVPRDRALTLLKSTKDPVAWCSLMFGFNDNEPEWRLRSYQKEQLRCNSLRLVVREGRRSGKTFIMALKLLYLAFNKTFSKGRNSEGDEIIEGPEIMIVTPYQSQISNIFSEMQKILERNTDLCKKITTGTAGSLYVKTPFFRMAFDNGAEISGFVSGVGNKVDGSGGGTMRGQNASIIYLDEMDMIPEEVLRSVVLPILATRSGVMLIATSTPIGKRGQFYKWCLEDPTWKEDYFPSTVLPQWDEIKHEVEAEGSQDSFHEEYMARFMDGAHGVFKPSYVYAARADYSYTDTERQVWWHKTAGVRETSELIKVIGIDWNKNAGTEFVVVAYHPGKHFWFVVESTNIPASKFNSISWKEEVIRLNYKWKPDYIYADEGYGHTIIEDLKLLGYETKGKLNKDRRDAQTAQLPERLIAFNFSSKVELTSPVDGQSFTKSGKEYLVENAVRVFEDERIWFPESDEALKKQLLHYIVLRRSPTTNKPVYGTDSPAVGDHRLDALMLALAGLSLECSVYSKNSAPMSAPQFLGKGDLDKRTAFKEGASAFDLLQGIAGPADRQGRRPYRMSQDDFLDMVSDQHPGRKTRRPDRGRSRIGKDKNSSLLEEILSRVDNPLERSRDPAPGADPVSRPHVVKTRRSKRRSFRRGRR